MHSTKLYSLAYMATPMATSAALCVPSSLSDTTYSGQGERSELDCYLNSTKMAQGNMDGGDIFSAVCSSVAPPVTYGPPVPGKQGNLLPLPRKGGSPGLAC